MQYTVKSAIALISVTTDYSKLHILYYYLLYIYTLQVKQVVQNDIFFTWIHLDIFNPIPSYEKKDTASCLLD
jgi:hypothetical protein